MASRTPSDRQRRQKAVNDALWAACDTFRGVIDPSGYKDYILATLFLKYVSDVWRDHEDAYRQALGDEALVARKMRYERFQLPLESRFETLMAHYNDEKLGERFNVAFEALATANPGKLDHLFDELDFNSPVNLGDTRDRNARLKHLLDDFSRPELDFRPSVVGYEDLIGNAYMYLIARFAADSGKKGGEFYTPYGVSRLLARLLHPRPGQRLYDPACGSGSLLIAVAEEAVGTDAEAHRNVALYGQELNHRTWALAKMNAFLHGFDAAVLLRGNTLSDPAHLVHAPAEPGAPHAPKTHLDRFDVVVSNPPFSLDKWPLAAFETDDHRRTDAVAREGEKGALYVPPRSRADYAFLLQIVASLHETGRAGVVVPNGVLFRGGAEGRIRQRLVEMGLVRAVVALPEKLFHGTGIPAALLILDRAAPTTDVLFLDATDRFAPGTRQNELTEATELDPDTADHVGEIVRAYDAAETVPGFVARVPVEEVVANDFNLNVARYVRPAAEDAPDEDLAALDAEIEAVEAELAALRQTLRGHLDALGL